MKDFDSVAFMRKVRTQLSEEYHNNIIREKKELQRIRRKYAHLFRK
ncbi:MAG: hypothetical protein QCI82_11825 [Candidatus Thermoplasmatota archaeon]|nr:hypothetical protein [Candidatus Thermoplasmatota archaeon]